jgi:hypothetical protein
MTNLQYVKMHDIGIDRKYIENLKLAHLEYELFEEKYGRRWREFEIKKEINGKLNEKYHEIMNDINWSFINDHYHHCDSISDM